MFDVACCIVINKCAMIKKRRGREGKEEEKEREGEEKIEKRKTDAQIHCNLFC